MLSESALVGEILSAHLLSQTPNASWALHSIAGRQPDVRSHVAGDALDVLDNSIAHGLEPAVSSHEAFARTVERHVSADELGLPAAQISVDWLQASPQSAETGPLGAVCMTDLRDSLEVSLREEPLQESVHCLEFSRTPKSFHAALDECIALRSCHDDMKSNNLRCKLESGTRLYLLPGQYQSVLQAIANMNLQSRHVVATSSVIDTILTAVAAIPTTDRVQEKSNTRQHIGLENICHSTSAAGSKETERVVEAPLQNSGLGGLASWPNWADWVCLANSVRVKNTFIHIPLSSSLRTSSSSNAPIASTTDADSRNGRNPRRR